jgi:hypothetical protein
LAWDASEVANPWVVQDWGSRFTRVGLTIIMSVKVQMPSLVNTILTHWWKELGVTEGSACSCSCFPWKATFCAMVAKVSWTSSWVPVCLLLWVQCKRWIFIRSVWTQCHQELLGERLVYGLKIFQGYQKTLGPRGVQTLEGERSERKQGNLWRWKREVCNIIDMMAIACSNELEFRRLLGHRLV